MVSYAPLLMHVMSAGRLEKDINSQVTSWFAGTAAVSSHQLLVNEVKGGCNPAPLNRKVEDGKVVLQINDILSGKQYFDFSKRG